MEILLASSALILIVIAVFAYLVRASIRFGEWFWRRRRARLQGRK